MCCVYCFKTDRTACRNWNLQGENISHFQRQKGKEDAEVSSEADKVFAGSEILLLGNESQTVGSESAPMEVLLILLEAGIFSSVSFQLVRTHAQVYVLLRLVSTFPQVSYVAGETQTLNFYRPLFAGFIGAGRKVS